jgi:predicted lipoprotein with Yx(FWY)xxD motif
MRKIAFVLLLAAAAALAIGCGDDSNGSQEPAQSSAAAEGSEEAMKDEDAMKDDGDAMEGETRRPYAALASTGGKGKVVKVVGSQFGRVIADRKGEAFYLFDKEGGKRSKCYGECAAVWPPVLTKGKPRAGKGAKARLLGTTRRANGKLQVTYAGHPLYYYVDDSPGTILCHDVAEFGGLWLVVKPNGRPAA